MRGGVSCVLEFAGHTMLAIGCMEEPLYTMPPARGVGPIAAQLP